MNLGQRLALTRPWWMWKNREIQDALRTAKLRHVLPVVDDVLRENQRLGRGPTSVKDLAAPCFLARNPRNMERVKDGTYALTDQHLIGLSVALKIPLDRLVPTTAVWIALATCELCGTTITDKQARAYSLYRVHCTAGPFAPITELDQSIIRTIAHEMNSDFSDAKGVGDAIAKAADALGTILVRFEGDNE